MGSFSKEELEFTFLDEGFTAKDILDQKINEVSSSVSMPRKGLHFMTLQVYKLGEQTASVDFLQGNPLLKRWPNLFCYLWFVTSTCVFALGW